MHMAAPVRTESKNTPIEKLLAEYEDECCDHSNLTWVKRAALRYVETMQDSQIRCLLYTLANAVDNKRWIPVTEQMPPMGMPVRVLANARGAEAIAWYGSHDGDPAPFWRLCAPNQDDTITHWCEADRHPPREEVESEDEG